MSYPSGFVSVIIPTFNSRNLLESAVDSVEAQTYRNFEIIIIDDGSTDDTYHWAEINSGRFRYYRQENKGQAAARNWGAELSKGEYVAFLDADDMWLPHKMESQMALLLSHPEYSFVFSDGYRIISTKSFQEINRDAPSAHRLSTLYARPQNPYTIDFEFRMHCVPTSSMVMKKCNYMAAGGMPLLRQGEDFVLCCMLLLKTPAYYIDEPLTYYRVHPGNITGVGNEKKRPFNNVRQKDLARIYVSYASGKYNHPNSIIDRYPRFPLLARLLLLLWWRLVFGSSKKKVFTDILRYIKA